eukprot:UN24657
MEDIIYQYDESYNKSKQAGQIPKYELRGSFNQPQLHVIHKIRRVRKHHHHHKHHHKEPAEQEEELYETPGFADEGVRIIEDETEDDFKYIKDETSRDLMTIVREMITKSLKDED